MANIGNPIYNGTFMNMLNNISLVKQMKLKNYQHSIIFLVQLYPYLALERPINTMPLAYVALSDPDYIKFQQ